MAFHFCLLTVVWCATSVRAAGRFAYLTFKDFKWVGSIASFISRNTINILSWSIFIINLPLNFVLLICRFYIYCLCLPYVIFCHINYVMRKSLLKIFSYRLQQWPKRSLRSFIGYDIEGNEKVIRAVKEIRDDTLLAIVNLNTRYKPLEYSEKLPWNIAEVESVMIKEHQYDVKNVPYDKCDKPYKSSERMEFSSENSDEVFKSISLDLSENTSDIHHGECGESENSLSEEFSLCSKNNEQYVKHENAQKFPFQENVSCSGEVLCKEEKMSDRCHYRELLTFSIESLYTTVGSLNSENAELKTDLMQTKEKLENLRNASMVLSQKVSELELQLQQTVELFQNVESDRDIMREKLHSLQEMIEEEEVFLNDDSSCDEDFSGLFILKKKLRAANSDELLLRHRYVPSPESCDTKSSFDLSLSR